jgi:hypothetical protein
MGGSQSQYVRRPASSSSSNIVFSSSESASFAERLEVLRLVASSAFWAVSLAPAPMSITASA